jgi:hypothetical protein
LWTGPGRKGVYRDSRSAPHQYRGVSDHLKPQAENE